MMFFLLSLSNSMGHAYDFIKKRSMEYAFPVFKMLVQLINVIYLAKIIPPAEYGIMAMALVIINLGILLRDLGTSAAIIKKIFKSRFSKYGFLA